RRRSRRVGRAWRPGRRRRPRRRPDDVITRRRPMPARLRAVHVIRGRVDVEVAVSAHVVDRRPDAVEDRIAGRPRWPLIALRAWYALRALRPDDGRARAPTRADFRPEHRHRRRVQIKIAGDALSRQWIRRATQNAAAAKPGRPLRADLNDL